MNKVNRAKKYQNKWVEIGTGFYGRIVKWRKHTAIISLGAAYGGHKMSLDHSTFRILTDADLAAYELAAEHE